MVINAHPEELDLVARSLSFFKEGKKTKQKNPFICIEERWWNLGHICPVQFVSLVSKEKIVRVVCQQLPENVLIFTSLILIL